MSSFTVEIVTDNAAWREMDGETLDASALADALREIADRVEGGTLAGKVRDYNGNACGYFEGDED